MVLRLSSGCTVVFKIHTLLLVALVCDVVVSMLGFVDVALMLDVVLMFDVVVSLCITVTDVVSIQCMMTGNG